MQQWKNVDDILDFAIEKEEEACRFYTDLAKKVKTVGMKQVFEQFAAEEQGHKQKLQQIKSTGNLKNETDQVKDLKMADYLADVEPGEHISYPKALIVAMKQEKAAFKLYNDLAAKVSSTEIRDLFLFLAQEEAKHKLRFELEYDEQVMQEN